MSKQGDLASTILGKCRELGCESPDDIIELVGGSTCFMLDIISEYLKVPFEKLRNEYIYSLLEAKIIEQKVEKVEKV